MIDQLLAVVHESVLVAGFVQVPLVAAACAVAAASNTATAVPAMRAGTTDVVVGKSCVIIPGTGHKHAVPQ